MKLNNRDVSLCLGTEQGSMSQSFREFKFADMSAGQWLCEETIFHDSSKVSYTMRAKTNVTMLEIASSDLKNLLLKEHKDYLMQVAL